MLPEAQDQPAMESEHVCRFGVPLPVAAYFFRPEFRVCLRRTVVLWTTVPVAAIYKDRDLGRGKDHVGGPWKGLHGPR